MHVAGATGDKKKKEVTREIRRRRGYTVRTSNDVAMITRK
jgi:hypothetical protein